MNPIDIFLNWQTLLVSVICWGVTQAIKTAYDIRLGKKEANYFLPGTKPSEIGRELRKDNPWINRLVLPGIPVVTGIAFVCLVPIRPDVLSEYVSALPVSVWTAASIYGTWGAACGMFADYIFSKAKKAFMDISGRG